MNYGNNKNLIEDVLQKRISDNEYLQSKSRVVVFLTLQNLSGKAEDGQNIKKKLEKVYNTHFDLVIIDETHYGAWAKCYGGPLTNKEEDEDAIKKDLKEYDEFIKKSNDKINADVKLHLSGTPYNLLYDEKFNEDNIIATCQFSNILKDKEKWIEDNNKKPENEQQEEWENPYFGFPKMLRFAFNIPESSQQKLIKFKKDGKWSLNDLLETNKDDVNTKFTHEDDVLQLLKAIDGSSKERGILGFLDIPKIKDNNVCKHIVMVLPYKYSCDAMELLLSSHKSEFKNLINDNVEVLNITGHKVKPFLSEIDDVKRRISDCEKQGKKTITLTVNKMLTGVTVPQWDTMIMLKNSKSPQEYDQAIFRIQNQYIVDYIEEKSGKIIKKDMKPQTILVDFDPMRMFELLGLSTRIVNKIKNDELTLEEALEVETKCFNIIAYNADKLIEVQPNNLIEIITNYNNKKSLMESVVKVKLNPVLLKNKYLEEFIKNQSIADISNKLTAKAHKGNKKDIDIPTDEEGGKNGNQGNGGSAGSDNTDESKTEMEKRYRMCVLGLSFYAFLSNSNICGLNDIIRSVEEESNEQKRNIRIFENLKLDKDFIKKHIELDTRLNSFEIDGFIKRANMLSKDEKLSPEDRAENALKNFSKISDSEIVTPKEICDKMVGCLGGENLEKLIDIVNNGGRILDIASKTGEFTYSIYSLLKDKVDFEKLKKSIYAIPTSSITYEFTRKMFENLGLHIENIANPNNITSYKLIYDVTKENEEIDYDRIKKYLTQDRPFNEITLKEEDCLEGENKVEFSAIVGNPPYQVTIKEATNGNNKNTMDVYQIFQQLALSISTKSCMIYPAKDFQRGKTSVENESLLYLRIYNGSSRNGEKHIPNEDSVFGDAVRRIPGDVSVSLYDTENPSEKIIYQETIIDRTNDILPVIKELLPLYRALRKYEKRFKKSDVKKVCESNFIEHNKDKYIDCLNRDNKVPTGYSKVLTNDKEGSGGKAKWYYIKTDSLERTPNLDRYKIILGSARLNESFANVKNIEILKKDESFGRSKEAIYDTDDLKKAENCIKYFSTKFAQYVNLMTPEKFLFYLPDFDSIYSEIDWKQPINEIDKKLYELYGLTPEEIQLIEDSVIL